MSATTLLTVEQVPIDQLRPDPANPRRISDEELDSLERSIRQFGFVAPVLARKEDSTVIGGHQRLVAARRLGLATVPVTYLDLSIEQARLLNLASTRSAAPGTNNSSPASWRTSNRARRSTYRCLASGKTRSKTCSGVWRPARSASGSRASISLRPSKRPGERRGPRWATSGSWAIIGCSVVTRPILRP